MFTHSQARVRGEIVKAGLQECEDAVVNSKPCRFCRACKTVKRDVFKGDKTAVFHTCHHMAAKLLTNNAMVKTKLIGDLLGHAS